MAYFNRTSLFLLTFLPPLSLAACSARSDADGASEMQRVSSPSASGLCSDPLPSADGQLLLLDICPTASQPGRLIIRKVHELTTVEVGTYPMTSKVLSLGANGEGYTAVVSKGESSYDVLAGKWKASQPAVRLDVGSIAGAAAAEGPKAIHITKDAKWVMGVSGATSMLFVSAVESGAVPTTVDLGTASDRHRFVSVGDRALVITGRSQNTGLGRSISLAGSPRVGGAIDLAEGDFGVIDETYNGKSVLTNKYDDHGSLVRIDLETGTSREVARGDALFGRALNPKFGAEYVWYSNQAKVFDELANEWYETDTLYRTRADGNSEPEKYRAVKNESIEFFATTSDGQHVLYWQGDNGFAGPRALIVDSTNGSGSPRVLLQSALGLATRRAGDRIVLSYSERTSPSGFGPYATVVIGADGAIVGTIPGLRLEDSNPDEREAFSGDGTVYYEPFDPANPVSCGASGSDFRVCGSDGFVTTLVPIPASPSIIAVETHPFVGIHRPRDMQIVTPPR
jgi:hypothetical protein